MSNQAIPTNEQLVWHDMEVGMFIHWAPYVYCDEGEKYLVPPIEVIKDVDFDCEQWVQTALDMGAGYIMLVAKHVGGFCLWQTDTTPYSVKNIAWREGKGDVVRDMSEICRRRGLRLGIYLSPADRYLGIKTGGVADTPERQQWYNEIYRTQLREVLDNYGDMCEIWFDGSTVCPIKDILDEHPGIIIFNSSHANIRWVGNEMGTARYPAWNGVPQELQPLLPKRDEGTPDGEAWMPLECDTTIRRGWFWTPSNEPTLKSLEKLLRTYYVTVGHGAVLLLNSNPDRRGRIPESDAARLREFGDLIRRLNADKLAYTSGEGHELTLTLSRPQKIDHVSIAEDIRVGELIREFTLEGRTGGEWTALANGSAIGHKHIIRVDSEKRFDALRLKVNYASGCPRIREFAAYRADLPIKLHEAAYEPAREVKIYAWDESIFYGVPLSPREFSLDLSDRFRAEEDVGAYELRLEWAHGQGRVLQTEVLSEGVVLQDYARLGEDGRVNLYVPGVGTPYTVRLLVEFDSVDTEGMVLLRKKN